jgi:tektin-2
MATAVPTKFAPADWQISNTLIRTSAERQRDITHRIRQEGNQTRNETDITTKWTQHNNNTYLHHRINDVSDWKETLQNTLSATESEIDQLSFTKAVTECALAAKEIPMNVTLECLSIRENRISIDLVRDNVEIELKKEMEVIEGVEGLLHQRISEAFGQLCILQECHQKLHFDITDKHSALEIDSTCLQLTNKSETIDLQKDPTRIKRGYGIVLRDHAIMLAPMQHRVSRSMGSFLYIQHCQSQR